MKSIVGFSVIASVCLSLQRVGAGECLRNPPWDVLTDDFYFTATAAEGATGDVVALDLYLTVENLRPGLGAFNLAACYDASLAELLGEPVFSQEFQEVFYFSVFVPRQGPNGEVGFWFNGVGQEATVRERLGNGQPFLIGTVFFRLIGDPGGSFDLRFCDYALGEAGTYCRRNNLHHRTADAELLAISTRHIAGKVRILEGEPTHPDLPPLPPLAKVYDEPPTAESASIDFELSGGVAQPGAREVPLDLYVTSNYEWSGFSVSLRFPAETIELARLAQQTRPALVNIDNAAGSLTMFVSNSSRRLGAEGERVKLATLYVNVKEGAALSEVRPSFEPVGAFLNWLAIHHRNGLNSEDLPVTAEVEPLTLTARALKIQREPTVLGDVNLDYAVNITDPVDILNFLFLGESLLCPEAADYNEDSAVNITDPVAILNYLFLGGPSASNQQVFCGRE